MSARVYNPLFLSEMRRMLRGGGVAGGAGSAAASAAATAGCGGEAAAASSGGGGGGCPPPTPPVAGLDRVRRQLFGPVDHEETRRFVQDELQAMRRRDTEHYGFDFEREAPLPGSRLVWEKVQPAAAVPASYALRRLPYLATHADAATDVAAEAAAASGAEDAPADAAPRGTEEKAVQTASPAPLGGCATSAETTPVAAAALAKATNNNNNVSTPKQTCISDFMKSRKRTSGPPGSKPNKIAQEGPSVKQAKKTHS